MSQKRAFCGNHYALRRATTATAIPPPMMRLRGNHMLRFCPGLTMLALLVATAKAGAQGASPCVTGVDTVDTHRQYLADLVSVIPANVANEISLPHQAVPDVAVVSNDSVCGAARDAYNLLVRPADSLNRYSRVVVVRVGTDRYVVTSPAQGPGLLLYAVYDTSFQRLATALH